MNKTMSKRAFRTHAAPDPEPAYPIADEPSRGGLLKKVGALVSAAALMGTLSACDSRAVPADPDPDGGPPIAYSHDGGVAPMMDAKLDTMPLPPMADLGGAPMMDAKLDDMPLSDDGAPALDNMPFPPDLGAEDGAE